MLEGGLPRWRGGGTAVPKAPKLLSARPASEGGGRKQGQLPRLPPKTLFWQDATAPGVTARRWAALQLYLDALNLFLCVLQLCEAASAE